jgi:hypothetical protein
MNPSPLTRQEARLAWRAAIAARNRRRVLASTRADAAQAGDEDALAVRDLEETAEALSPDQRTVGWPE